ncbi:tetratricopeptide repeat protein [Flavobacterium sp.]|uniref:tetratricopeptide repeat protein n=1 Tax=Flavobacterium sp. TaxID=239 RepID=UPI0039E462DB
MKFIFLTFLLLPFSVLSQTDFEKAEKLFAAQKFLQAKPLFENDLKAHPNHLQSIEYIGDIYSHTKKWDAAVSCYRKLKTANPQNADYQYKFGGALAMMANDANRLRALTMIDEIETAFLSAIKLNPKHLEARWALVELYLQLPGIFGGSESKATRYANELAALSPVDGCLSKGRIAEYFERYAVAESCYRKAIEIGHSKTTYQKLADLYQNKMNQPEKAKAVWADYNKTKS